METEHTVRHVENSSMLYSQEPVSNRYKLHKTKQNKKIKVH